MEKASPSVDFKFLDQMLRIAKGNPSFVIESVRRFIETGNREITDIVQFRESHDRRVLKSKTHRLISTCSVVGAMRMIDISQDLSTKAEEQDFPILEEWLNDLEGEFGIVKKTLNDYVTKIAASN